MIVLDTHVWLWWISDRKKLSKSARAAIDAAVEENAVRISSISVCEVVLLVERGRLELTMDVDEWIARCEALPFLEFVAIDNRIAALSVRLPSHEHPDPADRMIIATSLTLGAPIVSKDDKMRRYSRAQVIW